MFKKPERPTFVTIKQIGSLLGVSTSSATRYSKLPSFPVPFKFTASRKVWILNEVMDWIMSHRRRA